MATFKTTLIANKVAQTVKRLFTMRETWVQSLGREDRLEKEMATHSNTLAWKIPWTGEQQSMGVAKSQTQLSNPWQSPWTTACQASLYVTPIRVAKMKQTNKDHINSW